MTDKYAPRDWAAHERPTMPGSPSTPLHSDARRWAFALVGVIVALTGGLGNALVVANCRICRVRWVPPLKTSPGCRPPTS